MFLSKLLVPMMDGLIKTEKFELSITNCCFMLFCTMQFPDIFKMAHTHDLCGGDTLSVLTDPVICMFRTLAAALAFILCLLLVTVKLMLCPLLGFGLRCFIDSFV